LIITSLPEGSEYGIDGTYVHPSPSRKPRLTNLQRTPRYHLTRRFSGSKLIPPGLHSITLCPPADSNIPFRTGYIRYFKPRERVLLRYDTTTENVTISKDEVILKQLTALHDRFHEIVGLCRDENH
ncbi:MAG: hypothetical protein EOO88_21090, partial [Pedobacter sp.]